MTPTRLERLNGLLKEDPDNSFILFAIAKEYEGMGEKMEAIRLFIALTEKDAQYVGTYYHLAQLYEETGDTEAALIAYQKGMAIAQAVKDQHAFSELQNAKMNLELEM